MEAAFSSASQPQSYSIGVKHFDNILCSASKKSILVGFCHDCGDIH
jgi:hypothetical protein